MFANNFEGQTVAGKLRSDGKTKDGCLAWKCSTTLQGKKEWSFHRLEIPLIEDFKSRCLITPFKEWKKLKDKMK